jgi:nitrate/nitrite-specific signal transduction histidine kinase
MLLVFFIYGLAFFSMGFAIALESRQSSGLRLASSLPFLATFGILHGLTEWSDMLLFTQATSPAIFSLDLLRLVRTILMGLSTLSLIQFGCSLLSSPHPSEKPSQSPAPTPKASFGPRGLLRLAPIALGLLWIAILALLVAGGYPVGSRQWLTHADIWARFLLYLPGSLLAGAGLISEARRLEKADFRQIARDARFAAVTFLLNALVAGLVVPPGQQLFDSPLNYESFQALFGVPVQLLRALSAVAIAFFVLRVLLVFRIQSVRQLEEANRRELRAQQEALEAQRRAQAEVERWNRELEARIQQRTAEISLRNKQLTAVNGIAAAINRSFDLRDILNQTLDKTLEALDADGGGIFLYSQTSCDPTTQLWRGLPEDLVKTLSTLQLDSMVAGQRQEEAFLTAPLKAKEQIVGLICVARSKGPGFDQEDGRLLTAIAHQVGIGVENARLFCQVQNVAALEERERIAREMHDGIAQVVGFLNLKTRMARKLVAGGLLEQAEAELAQMQKVVQEAYSDIRQSILSLRTATDMERGLEAAIRESAADFTEQNAIPVELALDALSEVSFPPDVEVQLVRIVQEALANVRKHSHANRVWIRAVRRDGEGLLTIEDDGIGFDLAQVEGKKRRSFGLETMKERAESVGARLEVASVPGEGTRVQVRFDFEQRATEPRAIPQGTAG